MKTLPKIASVLFCLYSVTLVLHAQVPQIINYQGRALVGSTNFNGTGQFKFALVNANGSTTFWSNDGTSSGGGEPTNAVSLGVSNGLYSVLLGDTAITNMTAIPPSVFNNSDVRLRVWFNDGTHGSQLLTPDQRIASVGYAVTAASAASVPAAGLTGTVPVTSGGTGAATAGGALANLGGASTSGNLSQFSATTSAQLAGVLSDETGTGSVVFHSLPFITSPTIAGQIIAAVGTATNPPYSFNGDTNTGMYSNALDTINFSTGGVPRMSISPTGVVSATTFSGSLSGNAATATTATNVSGVVGIANGGTGSSTQNFVDLSTNQAIAGIKTFNGNLTTSGNTSLNANSGASTTNIGTGTTTGAVTIGGGSNNIVLGSPITTAANGNVTLSPNGTGTIVAAKELDANAGVRFGSTGDTISFFKKVDATLDFPNTAGGTCSNLPVTVTGAQNGDIVLLGQNANFCGGFFTAFASGTDTVTIAFNNPNAVALDPVSRIYHIVVMR